MKKFSLVAAAFALALASRVEAQTAKTITEDYDNVIKAGQTVTALGPNLFGEAVNLRDGTTSFSATDVSLPTNSGLPVAVGRSYGVNSRDIDQYVNQLADGEMFGNWKLDVPYMSGVYDERTGWVSRMANPQQRCSVSDVSYAGPPGSTAIAQPTVYYDSTSIWNGDKISIPGKGESSLLYLPAGRSRPNDGNAYYWTTKNHWRVRCLPSIKNGTGEGYVAVLPDGTKYTFDWMSSRKVAALKDKVCVASFYNNYSTTSVPVRMVLVPLVPTYVIDPINPFPPVYPSNQNTTYIQQLFRAVFEGGGGSVSGDTIQSQSCTTQTVVNRREYFLYATKVEDRFGNWVKYDYDPTNPRRLTAITSNDGASISLTYGSNGKVATITANGRTWQYQYTSADGAVLAAVVLPDSSRWTFQYGDLYGLLHYENQRVLWPDCEPALPNSTTAALTIGHPSGAQGVFTFQNKLHGTDRTPGACYQPDPDRPLQVELSSTVMAYKAASLISKQITGPGLPAQTWSYAYTPSWSWNPSGYMDNPNDPTTGTTTTDVTAPDGTITRSVFGNDYFRNAGQLQRVDVLSGGSVVSSTAYTYIGSADGQAFPDRVGYDPNPRNNVLETEKLRPEIKSQLTQEGVTYTSEVQFCVATMYCFTEFAQPTVQRRSSTLGYSRSDVTDYENNFYVWVLGQNKRGYNNDTGGMVEYEVGFNGLAQPVWFKKNGVTKQTLTYNADGTVATAADGNGNVTTLTGWKRGIPLQVRYPITPEAPAGATQSASIDDNGWVQSVIDETGAKTCYSYDVMGRISNVLYPSETQSGVCDASRWANRYSEFRQLSDTDWMPSGIALSKWRQFTSEGSHVKITYMDAFWRPVLIHEYDATNVGPTLRSTRFGYDAMGRQNFQSYPVSDLVPLLAGSRTSYDALGRVTRVEQDAESGVLATTTEYLPGLKTKITNPRGFATTTSFMAWDQPTYDFPIRSDQPENKVIEIARHPQFGWPLQLTQRKADNTLSMSRKYVYDGNAQLCKTIEPETGVSVMGYDGAGNLTWQALGLSSTTFGSTTDCQYAAASSSGLAATREYDAHNRLTKLNFPGGLGNQIWTYEKDNLPTSVTAYNSANNTIPVVTSYVYNKRRMLVGESLGQPGWYNWGVGYNYDNIGNLRWQSYPDGLVIDYAPNALGQATQAVDGAAKVYATAAAYYPNGALKQFTYGNGIVHTMTQNARQLPTRVTDSNNALDYDYAYDANGNVERIYDYVTGTPTPRHRWMGYDGLDRLTSVASAVFGGSDQTHRFTYDALDNMKSWKLAGVKDYADYIYDQNNRLISIRNTAGATVVGIDYDAQGNLRNKNGQAYDFDYGNRLRGVTGKEYYRYDGLGRRALNWRYPTATTPNGTLSLSQYTQSGQLVYQWDDQYPKYSESIYLAGSVIAIRDIAAGSNAVTVKYQHTDALGSPVAVTNEAGAVIERNDYEPYGAIIGKPAYNGIGYTGHMMDGATSLTYMQQRYYDESIGRFLSVDPVGARLTSDNFNRYAYAFNKPYLFNDPDGRDGLQFYNYSAHPEYQLSQPDPEATATVLGIMADFTPVVGDIKGIVEAYQDPTPVNIISAGVGLIPLVGDVVGKGIKYSGRAERILRLGEDAARACSFDETTLVQTDHGLVEISKINQGDFVLSRNQETGRQGFHKVLDRFFEWHDSTLSITVMSGNKTEVLITTAEHPFFVISSGFVSASELKIGDQLLLAGGKVGIVSAANVNAHRQIAYNLSVEGDHTYFVGTFGILVHNSCKIPGGLFRSTKEAADAAIKMGFRRVNGAVSHGQAVFTDGKRFISRDIDSHNGGAWKMADSLKDLMKKETRSGTYNADLTKRLGD